MWARTAFLTAAIMVGAPAHGQQATFVLTPGEIPSTMATDPTPPAPSHATSPRQAMAQACAFRDRLEGAAWAAGLEPELLMAVAHAETRCRHEGQRSPKGAIGLMQLMPATARRFGARDPWDIDQNIAAGAAYLAWLSERYDGDIALVAAAYNAGEGAVDAHGGVPPFRETRAYVRRVQAALANTQRPPTPARARIEPPFVFEVGAPESDWVADAAE